MIQAASHWVLFVALSLWPNTGDSKCFQPAVPSHGEYKPLSRTYETGEKVKYTCAQEYFLFGDEVRECETNGNWTSTVPSCDVPYLQNDILTSSVQTSKAPNGSELAVDGDVNSCSATFPGGVQTWTGFLRKLYFVFGIRILPRGQVDFKLEVQKEPKKFGIQVHGNFSGSEGEGEWKNIAINQMANHILIGNTLGNAVELCEIQFFACDVGSKTCCSSPPPIDVVENGRLMVNHSHAVLQCDDNYSPRNKSSIRCIENLWGSEELKCTSGDFGEIQMSESDESGGKTEFTTAAIGAVAVALGVVCIALVIIILTKKRQTANMTSTLGPSTSSTRSVAEEDQHYYESFFFSSDVYDGDTAPEVKSHIANPGSTGFPTLSTLTLAAEYCSPPISKLNDTPCCVYNSTEHFPPYDDTEPQDAYKTPSGKCFGHVQCDSKPQ